MASGLDAAVLVSGGVESAVLAVELLKAHRAVHPIYVRSGLRWEAVELAHLRRYLERVDRPGLLPLTVLDDPVGDLYGAHWSTGSGDAPDEATPDEAMELPGRNLLLLTRAGLWCQLRGVGTLALGTLQSNPFPDSTAEFTGQLQAAINLSSSSQIELVRPFAGLQKTDVLGLGQALPLWLTFSCVAPRSGQHCGRCNKCGERRGAFRRAGLVDLTEYADATVSV